MSEPRYAKNAGAVFSLKHHIVWCPKYRRPVRVPSVEGRLKELFAEVAREHDMKIHAVEVMCRITFTCLSRATRCSALPRSSIASKGARAAC